MARLKYPLSQSQLGIFYACQNLEENAGNYQVPLLYHLPPDIELSRLKQALELFVKGHPYILSRIVMQDGELMMEQGDYTDDLVSFTAVDNLDEVRSTFCRTMDMLHERLFRMEIYQTPKDNYLYLDFHHILIDGTSTTILMTEIGRAYDEGAILGEDLNGGDIALLERELRKSEEWNAQREWYLKEFASAEDTDSMPVPSNIGRKDSDRGLVETNFPLNLKEDTINSICQKYGARENIVFTAAWGKLLANYTAEDKASFATIFHGRTNKRTLQAMTMMVHTMPVFMEMPGDKPVGTWLQEVADQQKNTREKSAYSFSDIHQDLNLRSDILFAYHGRVVPTTIFDLFFKGFHIKAHDLRIARPGITIDGQLLVTPNATPESDFNLRISYKSFLYSSEMIAEMAESYAAILNSMATAETIGQLSASSERQLQWLDKLNPEKPLECPHNISVIDLFNENVEKYPDNECCVFENNRFTYREIGELTDRLAAMIQSKVKKTGEELPVVSFIVPRNELMLIVPVAIVKAGCTYQPLDSTYPKDRLNFMIADAEAQLLICPDSFRPMVDEYTGESLIINTINDISSAKVNVKVNVRPDDVFILLYTSGTTGTPKGVMLTCRNILAFSQNHTRNLQIDHHSCLTAYASYGFDAYLMDLWAAMTAGAALHIISEEIRYDLVALHDYFVHEKISHAFMTTQVGTQLVNNYPDIPSLKVLSTGGEKLVSLDPPHYRLVNLYGPTETTVYVSSYDVCANEPNIPIGFSTESASLYVVNKDFQRVPMGAIGELWIAGTQTARGYLKLPEKTASAFVDNPFADGNPYIEKAYRSGDIVRYREDGAIEFIGRKDGQVKIRGFRIELKEVEAVIRNYPGIENVTVQAFDLEAGGKAVAAFVVSSEKIDIQYLNDFIREQKPPYMVPAVTMQIDDIPLNVNGKVDKKALPKPEVQKKADSSTDVAPLNELEKELKTIIASVLKTEDFGATDVLGYVGLTSISSIRLATLIYNRFGVHVDTKNLSKTATIMSIEEQINAESGTSIHAEIYEKYTEAPLTHSQQGVYAACVHNADSVLYNIPFGVRMPGNVTAVQLENALRDFVAAHAYINSCFVSDADGNVMQHQMLDFHLDIPLKHLDSTDLEIEKRDFVRPFRLAEGPLYRFEIISTPVSTQGEGESLYLLADFHHLIADGGSIDIFLSQLCALLDGAKLESERYDYFNFARDQKISEETEAFYETQMAQIEEASELLPDVYEPVGNHQIAQILVHTDLNAVAEKCRQLGVTPAALYLAATTVTVSKYVAEDTVGVCTISNGRSNSRISESFGMFVNTLPFVSTVDAGMSVDDYLKNVSGLLTETIAHEEYPFAKIAEKYNFLANIMFAYQVGVINQYVTRQGVIKPDTLELDVAKFPVAIYIEDDVKNGGEIRVEYDTDLYSKEMMTGFAEAVRNVAEECLVKKHIADIELCNGEQLALLESFNHPLPEIGDETVLDAFRMAARQYPDNIAAVYGEKRYTYRELDELTDRIGAYIYAKVKDQKRREPVVSMLIPRNEYMFILPLSAMKAGCAYQPLDPTYPQDRLNFMVKDADAALLITDEQHQDIIKGYEGEIALTDSLLNLEATELPVNAIVPESLFILLYTSGSTGVPKGVMLEHRNLMAFIYWYRRYYELRPEHNVAAYVSFGFDVCMMDMYPALTSGATVHIIPEDMRLDLVALDEYIEANAIIHIFFTTQVGVQFHLNIGNKSLKHLSVAGEKLVSVPPANSYVLHNGYGPTECTVFTTIFPVLKNEPNIPIGKPLDSINCYVVDKNLHRLPVGAAGELIIAGDQIGRGYLNRPEKTAEAFFTLNGRRAYHSGDIVRYRQDGNIEFVGRKDGQVKIRGFRIELKEIEGVIRDFPGIEDVTVQAYDDPNGGKFVAAYVVSDNSIDVGALNSFILDRKPPYMVPEVTMQIDRIPLNVNLKVDKKALPKPERQQKADSSSTAAPLNELEKDLKAIIASVVNTEDFGVTDMLGYVGLTSISSIRLATLIYKKYGIQLNAKTLFKTGSLQSIENEILKEWMERSTSDKESGTMEKDTQKFPVEIRKVECAPLSFAQQGVYTECIANAGSLQYNMPEVLHFPEGTTAEGLKVALMQILAAHPYMMCHFVTNDRGEVIQKPIDDFQIDIPVHTMDREAFETYKQQFARPFNPSTGPLFRWEIVVVDRKASQNEVVLLSDIHHLIGDGATLNLLYHQLCQVLDGETIQKEEYDYYQFVQEQTPDVRADDYFAQTLGGVEEVSRLLPDLYTEQSGHHPRAVRVPIAAAGVQDFCRAQGITPAAFFLAATALSVSRFLCEEDVSLITISNGRSNLKVSDTAGMFVNTLPIAMHLGAGDTVAGLLQHADSVFTEAVEHENYPFARVASKYGFTPQISYACQLGVMEPLRTRGGEVGVEELELDTVKVPVSVSILGSIEGEMSVLVEYDSSLYSASMVQHFAESIANVASALTEKQYLKEISLTTAKDWTLLDTFNAPLFTDYDHDDTVVSLFRKQVRNHPDKLAAIYGEKRYSYRQLDEVTDLLASIIYEKVSAMTAKTKLNEEVVSIIIDRNEWVFLLPLAVLKTGCAYEPLDPSYPSERLNFMVSDARSCLLIGQPEFIGLVSEYEGEVLNTSDLEAYLNAPASRVVTDLPAPAANDLLLMLYTSGSTGIPKGVQFEHHNLVTFAHGISKADFYTEDCVAAAYLSFGFDVCMMDTFCTLLNGGTLVVIPEDMRLEFARLTEYMESEKVTQIFMTTQVGVQFVQNYPSVKYLRYIGMGGEKLPAINPEGMSYKILNGYGPTENTCGVSLFPVKHWEPNIPLGRPFPTILGYVLDKSGHRLPPGACGEYCVAGDQAARGYLGLPEKTAEVFVEYNALRMYHTGDIVRYRENGDVEFVGRKDGMVKIRGFRIELKEVEAVIRTFDHVEDVTVQAYEYESGGKYLAAFVVSSQPTLDVEALLSFVKSKKPPYMVPSVVMQIDRIPLTVNQKVDKKALPKPNLAAAAFVAPKNKIEEDFCTIFGDVLDQEKVSAASDFFEIGGSSIVALKVVIAAEKLGYSIVYKDVFSYPTAQSMAAHLGAVSEPEHIEMVESQEKNEPVNSSPVYGPGTTEVSPDGYDYRAINTLLRGNTLEAFKNGRPQPIGDVLLAGATGYLGVHVLKDLIDHYTGKIYCFVRSKGTISPERRLLHLLYYYFEKNYSHLFASSGSADARLFLVEGDATDPNALDGFEKKGITVINCAACVKHFSRGNEIEKMNVESVRNLIKWCAKTKSRLVHVSTGSVMGTSVNNMPPKGFLFNEQMLYVGQRTDNNQYIHSKFIAERCIYEAILNEDLNAKVMRVGNLAPRDKDGEFQINFNTNNFMATLAAYNELGMIPYSNLDSRVEFSPIDKVARAILLLASTPRECVCFMPSNQHRPLLGDVVMQLAELNNPIRMVETEEFIAQVRKALDVPEMVDKMRPLMAYAESASGNSVRPLGYDDLDVSYTAQVLYRLGFNWPTTTEDYVRRFLATISGFLF